MLSFFKVLLRGIIVTVLLPLILVVWVLYGVYCLITFIVMFIKSTVLFFMGDSINDELKEDVEAKRMLLEKEQAQSEQQQFYSNMNNMLGAMAQQMQQQFQQQNPGFNPNPAPQVETQQPETIEYKDVPSQEPVDTNEEGGNDNV